MNRLRSWIRGFFGFSRTETNAFLIMLPLMAVLVFSEPVYRTWFISRGARSAEENSRLDSLVATWTWKKPTDRLAQIPLSLFTFNPNHATLKELTNLGLSQPLSIRIVNYRVKGGKFKIKNDLNKIYGMDSSLFLKLAPFIDLPEKMTFTRGKAGGPRIARKINQEPFDLNLADTSQLVKIYGLGSRLSLRIIKYRDRLGGFVSLNQLEEVYGLDTTVIRLLKRRTFVTADFKPRLININTAGEKELSSLPYVKFALAKSIAVYRYQHGEFNSVDELKKIALMDENTFHKIKPYITVKD